MTDSGDVTGSSDATPEEIEERIEARRDDLKDSFDQLAAKVDVPARTKAKVRRGTERLTDDMGRPLPELVLGAGLVVAVTVALVVWRRRR